MDIGSLTGSISLDDDLSSKLDLATSKVREFASSFDGMTGAVIGGSALVVTAITAVGATVFGLAEHAATAAEAIENFNIKTGVSVEAIGPLQFAVTAAGGSLDQLNMILMRLSMREASDSTGKFSGALADLGINADAFGKMNSEEKILALGAGFASGAISGTKMSDAMALMGRGGANMIPVLEKMTPELMAMAQASGIIWSQEDLDRSHMFDVSLSAMTQTVENISTRIGIALLPAMSDLMHQFATSPEFISNVVTATDLLAHSLGYLVEGAGYLVTGFISLGAACVNVYGMIESLAVGIDKFVLGILEDLSLIPGVGPMLTGAIASVTGALKINEESVAASKKTYDALVTTGGFVYDTTQRIGTALESVGTKTDVVTTATTAKAAADAQAAAAAATHEKAVMALMDTLEGEGEKILVLQDAVEREIDLDSDSVDTKQRVVDAIDNLTKAHIPLTAAMQSYYDLNKQLGTAEQKLAETTESMEEKLDVKLYTTKADLYATDTQKLATKRLADYDNAASEAQKKGIVDVNYYNALWSLYLLDEQKDDQRRLEKTQGTREYYQAITLAAEDAYNFALDHLDSFTTLQIQKLGEAYQEAAQDSNHWAAVANGDLDSVAAHCPAVIDGIQSIADKVQLLSGEWVTLEQAMAKFNAGNSFTYDLSTDAGIAQYQAMNPMATIQGMTWKQIEAYAKQGGTLAQLIQQGIINPYGGMAHAAEGGTVMVGENGPEMVQLPYGSTVFPTGSEPVGVLGAPQIIQLVVDSRVLAEVMNTAQVTRQRRLGRSLPTGVTS